MRAQGKMGAVAQASASLLMTRQFAPDMGRFYLGSNKITGFLSTVHL